MYRLKNFDRLSIALSASDYIVLTCFDKNTVGQHRNASAGDFISVVLIRMLPGALSRLIFAMTSPFCLAKSASWFLPEEVGHKKTNLGAGQ